MKFNTWFKRVEKHVGREDMNEYMSWCGTEDMRTNHAYGYSPKEMAKLIRQTLTMKVA